MRCRQQHHGNESQDQLATEDRRKSDTDLRLVRSQEEPSANGCSSNPKVMADDWAASPRLAILIVGVGLALLLLARAFWVVTKFTSWRLSHFFMVLRRCCFWLATSRPFRRTLPSGCARASAKVIGRTSAVADVEHGIVPPAVR